MEEKINWPVVNIEISHESLQKLRWFFDTEKYIMDTPGARERLAKESEVE